VVRHHLTLRQRCKIPFSWNECLAGGHVGSAGIALRNSR
jgi:hypothetical protein